MSPELAAIERRVLSCLLSARDWVTVDRLVSAGTGPALRRIDVVRVLSLGLRSGQVQRRPSRSTGAWEWRAADVRTSAIRIVLDGQLVAQEVDGALRLAPSIAHLPLRAPIRRVADAMCRYASSLDSAAAYDNERAARYAREVLIDDQDFRDHERLPDLVLAGRYLVPVAQIVAKRADLARRDGGR